jgi:hypothetical protein
MNTRITEITKPGDPMIRIKLPAITLKMMKATAKKHKRRAQDQFIKSLAESVRNNEVFSNSIAKYLPDLTEIYQQEN